MSLLSEEGRWELGCWYTLLTRYSASDPSRLLVSCSPTRTLNLDGYLVLPATQWAAVTTCLGCANTLLTRYSASDPSLLRVSCSPTRTLNLDGYLVLPATQCAAVTTCLGPTIEPPQPPRPLYNKRICHGHEPRVAVTPAITR